jgi:predicted phage tail protein
MTTATRIIEGMKTNTLYTVRVRAKNALGKWGDLSDVLTITTQKDTTAPAVPTGGSLQVGTPNFFTLNWIAGTEKDLEAYNIYVFTSNTPASAKIIKRVGWSTNYVLILDGDKTEDGLLTIASSTTYYFWLTAVDESGNESAKLSLGSGNLSIWASPSISPSISKSPSPSPSPSESPSVSPSQSPSSSVSPSSSESSSASPSVSSSPSPSPSPSS